MTTGRYGTHTNGAPHNCSTRDCPHHQPCLCVHPLVLNALFNTLEILLHHMVT